MILWSFGRPATEPIIGGIMWTLIVFTLLFAGTNTGGTSASVITIQFQTQQGCNAAVAAIAEDGVGTGPGGAGTAPGRAYYRIEGKCIQTN